MASTNTTICFYPEERIAYDTKNRIHTEYDNRVEMEVQMVAFRVAKKIDRRDNKLKYVNTANVYIDRRFIGLVMIFAEESNGAYWLINDVNDD